MSEIKKLTIVGIVIAILFSFSIIIYGLDRKGGIKQTNNSTSNADYVVYYLGREGCGYCQMFTPSIKKMKEKYNVKYEYIDIDTITSEELSNYLEKFHITGKFGTPSIAIMKIANDCTFSQL